jgi:hypothetical protein
MSLQGGWIHLFERDAQARKELVDCHEFITQGAFIVKYRGALERRSESRELGETETFSGTFEVMADTPDRLEISGGERGARSIQIIALTGEEAVYQDFQIFLDHYRERRQRAGMCRLVA